MALTFPSTDVDGRLILTGPAKVYIADQTSNGADASVGNMLYLGSTDGGCEVHWAVSKHPISVDQYLNEIEAVPIKEEVTVKTKILQLNVKNLYDVLKDGDNKMSSGGTYTGGIYGSTDSGLAIGELKKIKYFQLLLKTATHYNHSFRCFQFYKAYVAALGPIKLEKPKESALEITWKCLTDVGAVSQSKAAIFNILDQ